MSLVGAALLIVSDRLVVAPHWSRHPSDPNRIAGQDRERYHGQRFAVTTVADADTLHIAAPDAGRHTTKVRLLGIDAPELAHAGRPAMYFAREATEYTRRLVQGAQVTVYLDETGPSRGKYGRLLAYIAMSDGDILNERLLAEGYVYADRRFPHSYYHRYKQLEASARALDKGLWAEVTEDQFPAWRRHAAPE